MKGYRERGFWSSMTTKSDVLSPAPISAEIRTIQRERPEQ